MSAKLILLTTAGTGVLGGGIACGYFFMQIKNLKEELTRDGYKPLSTDEGKDKDTWTKLLTKYEAEQKPKIEGLNFDGANNDDDKIKKLQEVCKGWFEMKKSDNKYDESLKHAKDWCISDSEKIKN